MPRPIIALLTDFGLRDHYVASMKAIVLGIAPEVTFVDITHDIAPQDVLSAALELAACYGDFPPGAIFLAVVDPGVGTARRPIAASAGGRFFVAPDNGILAPVLEQQATPLLVELTNPAYARPTISSTFEGRDRFAPAAAWLARGTDIRALGPPLAACARLDVPQPSVGDRAVAGEILKVDRFGNLISNIPRRLLDAVSRDGPPIVHAGGHDVTGVVKTYAAIPRRAVCALVGSGGYVEIAANGDSAAKLLGLARGARIVVAADRAACAALDEPRA
jgi:S-adenosylmethionine hydrolase